MHAINYLLSQKNNCSQRISVIWLFMLPMFSLIHTKSSMNVTKRGSCYFLTDRCCAVCFIRVVSTVIVAVTEVRQRDTATTARALKLVFTTCRFYNDTKRNIEIFHLYRLNLQSRCVTETRFTDRCRSLLRCCSRLHPSCLHNHCHHHRRRPTWYSDHWQHTETRLHCTSCCLYIQRHGGCDYSHRFDAQHSR